MRKWKRGIGNDCCKIWDERGRLVAIAENPKDAITIVNLSNQNDLDIIILAAIEACHKGEFDAVENYIVDLMRLRDLRY